jgi:16S rRNA (uracil1498-N3)-methyltransferase
MTLPFFYIPEIQPGQTTLQLDEDTSKHVTGVLRKKPGDALHLTDGKGHLLSAVITDDHKKRCIVSITHTQETPPPARKTIVAISLLKNVSRFEWFLEKATEIGITAIIPLICDRTEKEHFRYDRMKNILVSALLQSQQVWLPVLHQPVGFGLLLKQQDIIAIPQKFIAHCLPGKKQQLSHVADASSLTRLILIGPEGDFTPEEINFALEHQYIPVALGDTRLRTETAGLVAAVLLSYP